MQSLQNTIRSIPYLRIIFFIIIGVVAVLQYMQTQSPSPLIEGILSILGIIKSFMPSGTAVMPSGEVVSTLKTPVE
jgi:disulfide bond formation protein DsbB